MDMCDILFMILILTLVGGIAFLIIIGIKDVKEYKIEQQKYQIFCNSIVPGSVFQHISKTKWKDDAINVIDKIFIFDVVNDEIRYKTKLDKNSDYDYLNFHQLYRWNYQLTDERFNPDDYKKNLHNKTFDNSTCEFVR